MAIALGDIDLDRAYVDLCARLACVRAAAEACAGRPERLLETARELHAFAMDGTSEDFGQLLLPLQGH